MKQVLFILLCFGCLSWVHAQTLEHRQKDTIEQYLVASQLYLMQDVNSYTRDRATIALEKAIQWKDDKSVARAYTILGAYGLKYSQIGFADKHLKLAKGLYAKIAQKDPSVKREALLCNIAYQKAFDATPSHGGFTSTTDIKSLLKQYKMLNGSPSSFENGLAMNLQLDTSYIVSNMPIAKVKPIDSMRFAAFHALWKNDVTTIQNIILWYYKNHVKSPEIHALETIYNNAPQFRNYYSYKLQESGKAIYVALTSDIQGDLLWKMIDTLDNSVQSYEVEHLRDALPVEKAQSIYDGLIHPAERTNWAIAYIGEYSNPCYLSYYDNNNEFKHESQCVNDINNFRYPAKHNILLSGNIIFAINCLAKQESIDIARMHFTKADIDDFDFVKDSTKYYNLMDNDRVNYNITLNSDQKMELLTEIKILKKIYPDIEKLRADFTLFKKMVDALDKNRNQIYLSRRGYPGDCLGTIMDAILNGKKKRMTRLQAFCEWFNRPLKTDD